MNIETVTRILRSLLDKPYEEAALLDLYNFYERINMSKQDIVKTLQLKNHCNDCGDISERYVNLVDDPSGVHFYNRKNGVFFHVIHAPVKSGDIFQFFRKTNGLFSTLAFHNNNQIYVMDEAMTLCVEERLAAKQLERID
jgi:hypothetical protein